MTDQPTDQAEISPLPPPSLGETNKQRLRHDLEPLRQAGCFVVVV